jgi:UDPglucose 6-dehydrogenase
MKIAVIGSGYVGLVASVCFASMDHDVVCVDCDAAKIDLLRAGKTPIYEPGLEDLISKCFRRHRLTFSTNLPAAVQDAAVAFIAVGTPDNNGDGAPDLTSVFSVARAIASAIQGYCVVVTKSTVPVGTGDAIEKVMAAHATFGTFDLVSNPEFLREGRAILDFKNPDRIVVGADSERARVVMRSLYSSERFGDAPILFTSRRSAELMKYAANAFLASKIAFINSISDLSEQVGADIEDISCGIGLDTRIGTQFLQPGPGYGGSCLPKDTRALVESARQYGAPFDLLQAIVDANRSRKADLANRVVRACDGSVAGRDIAVLGLTFKADTDDMREAPALCLVEALQSLGARVCAYDPAGMHNAAQVLKGVRFAKNAYACVKGAHAVVIVTDWKEFQTLDFHRMQKLVAAPVLVDLRNLYEPMLMQELGWRYFSVGRKPVLPDLAPYSDGVLHHTHSLARVAGETLQPEQDPDLRRTSVSNLS